MWKGAVFATLLALAVLPLSVSAAGFARESLFLSKTPVTEGETVLIHAVVNNDTAAKFDGQLVFSDESGSIGSVPVTLGAKEASVVSISWKPLAGSHKVAAELRQGTTVVEKEYGTFEVAKKPAATATTSTAAAAVESSSGIQQGISSVSPAVANVTAPVFTLIDGGRSAAADVLDSQLANTKTKLGPSAGNVLGADEVKNAGSNPMGAFWFALYTLYFYILTLLRFIIGSAAVFYPAIALLFLFTLWKLVRRLRRPSY